jgi:hypothetical protein
MPKFGLEVLFGGDEAGVISGLWGGGGWKEVPCVQ